MRSKQILGATLVASVVVGTTLVFMATQKLQHYSFLHQVMLGLSGAMTVVSSGASVLFLLSRKDFKAGPRKAYGLLCIGIVLFGISQVQFPLLEYFELRYLLRSVFAGLIALPYLLSVAFTILGTRMLVRSLGITTRWASLPWMIGAALAAMLLSTFVPHTQFEPGALRVAQINGAFALGVGTFYLFAAQLAWRVRKEVGPFYKQAMTWLFAGLAMMCFSVIHGYGATRFFHGTWYEQDNITTIPLFLVSVLFVMAGNATLAIRRRFEVAVTSASGNVFLDVVMYAANLASTPRDIDQLLDTVRQITAATSGTNFTPSQEQRLCQTYLAIENYLVSREPMHPFDAEGLREHVTSTFNLTPVVQSKLWGTAVGSTPSW